MYCNKCGERLPEGSGFCSKCGNKVRPAEPIQLKSKAPSNAFARAKAFGVANTVLVLLLFTPWIEINAYIVSSQLSLLDIYTNASDMNSAFQSYLGSSADQASSALGLIMACAAMMFFAMIATNAADAFRFFTKGNGTISGFVTSLICSTLVVVAVFLLNAYISSSSSPYYSAALSGILSATAWPWLVAISCIVLIYLKCKHCTAFIKSDAPDSMNTKSSH